MEEKARRCVKNGYHGSLVCTRRASVLRAGKPYCWQHDPERVQSERDRRDAEWNKKWEDHNKRKEQERQRELAKESIIAQLMAMWDDCGWLEKELPDIVMDLKKIKDNGWQPSKENDNG